MKRIAFVFARLVPSVALAAPRVCPAGSHALASEGTQASPDGGSCEPDPPAKKSSKRTLPLPAT